MALTTLDNTTALLVVDLQKGLLGSAFSDPLAEVAARARVLIDAFRVQELPVVLINVAGTAPGRTEQPPRLRGALPEGFTGHCQTNGRAPKQPWNPTPPPEIAGGKSLV